MNHFVKFFEYARVHLFNGNMDVGQMLGTQATLNEWQTRGLTDLRFLAYMLATQKWETAHTMLAVRETLAKTDAEARRRLGGVWYAVPDPVTGHSYYGRGNVQLTHKRNYAAMGKLLDLDLVNNPDLALDPAIATSIMFEGMMRGASSIGDFTGLALEDFFTNSSSLWVGARRIVNGTDHDGDIAVIALGFHAALNEEAHAPLRLLMYGAEGEDVKLLQTALVALGYDVAVDGDFGPMTMAAVVSFQIKEGIDGDGKVGPLTRRRLRIE